MKNTYNKPEQINGSRHNVENTGAMNVPLTYEGFPRCRLFMGAFVIF